MIISNQFRQDLWFRLHVFPINIPPLRERKEDILALIQYFIKRKSSEKNIHPTPAVESMEIDRLKAYHWPGNVRELENIVERALIQYQGQNISGPVTFENVFFQKAEHSAPKLSSGIHEPLQTDMIISIQVKQIFDLLLNLLNLMQGEQGFSGKNYNNSTVARILPEYLNQKLKSSFEKIHVPQAEKNLPISPVGKRNFMKLEKAVALHIQEALEMTEGKINGPGGAAELLGMNPNTLRSKMRKLCLLHKKKDLFGPIKNVVSV